MTALLNMLDYPSLGVNSTLLNIITPTSPQPPWYYAARPSLLPFVSDKILGLAAPTVVYWVLSLTFYALDLAQIPYFESKRIHESEEVLARNKVTVAQVIRAVLWQQVVQTLLGLWWLEDDGPTGSDPYYESIHSMAKLAPTVAKGVFILLGPKTGEHVLRNYGEALVRWVYWWGIPSAQMWLAL